MAFKVNYGLERAERNRAKQAKKDAKVKARTLTSDNAAHHEMTDKSSDTDPDTTPAPDET